jgi:hypothetical protein
MSRRWLGELLCRLGLHKMTPRWECREKYWDGPQGGDCERCGLGPLRVR